MDKSLKTGYLLMNIGTPSEPTVKGVRTYLKEFLSDPDVIDNRSMPGLAQVRRAGEQCEASIRTQNHALEKPVTERLKATYPKTSKKLDNPLQLVDT